MERVDGEERTFVINIDHLIEHRLGERFDRRKFGDAGVHEEHIDAAIFLGDRCNQLIDVGHA